MQKNKENIIKLAEGAKTGDSQAAERLVKLFHNDIFKMIFYRTGSKMDAEDITQEVFMKMVKNIKNIRDTSLFKAWLYRIAVNKVTDYYRKKAVLSIFMSKSEPEDSAFFISDNETLSENPSEILMKKEFYSILFDFTKILPKGEKEIFLLRFVDQLGIREISLVIGKNESTVKTHLYRSIKKFKGNTKLRSMLGGNYES